MLTSRSHAHPFRRSLAPAWAKPGWKTAGALALLCSTVAWASLPRAAAVSDEDQRQWQALGLAPLSSGGTIGMAMAPTDAAAEVAYAPKRAIAPQPQPQPGSEAIAVTNGPVRIRGIAGDGLYWALRSAGASPQVTAEYLRALATEIDVGEVESGDGFDLVLGSDHELLYAGLNRVGAGPLQLVKWTANGRSEWVDAANAETPASSSSGMTWPANGPITSYFGYRYHPILHFTRFHAGVDIGAAWGSPIVAAADGQVVGAGWAGGYGREVQIAHAGGLLSIYGHMSQIVAQRGTYVHQGELIGYVGMSGLATGPHVHFEVRLNGTPVNPLGVRFTSAPLADPHLAEAVKARLHTLLGVDAKRS